MAAEITVPPNQSGHPRIDAAWLYFVQGDNFRRTGAAVESWLHCATKCKEQNMCLVIHKPLFQSSRSRSLFAWSTPSFSSATQPCSSPGYQVRIMHRYARRDDKEAARDQQKTFLSIFSLFERGPMHVYVAFV
ncbi:hypothetical protein BDZ89DRAFT_1065915 [Hymenopellis radicata]|nr:hypothetical protein BDZ89DRAFT_1065915 [Hymenopellis radicata]